MLPPSSPLRRLLQSPHLRWGGGVALALGLVATLRVVPRFGVSLEIVGVLLVVCLWYAIFGALGHAIFRRMTRWSRHFLVQVAAVTIGFWLAFAAFDLGLVWHDPELTVRDLPLLLVLAVLVSLLFGVVLVAADRAIDWLDRW